MRPLVIAHAPCTDGFTAYWIADRALGGVDYHPAQYGNPPPDVFDRDVYVLDFSYPREVLEEMHWQARSITVLDHHKTAQADLEGLDFCQFDMDRSGAMMAWDHFHPGEEAPWLVKCVQDRDLWRWELGRSREVNAYIRSWPFDLQTWDMMNHPRAFEDAARGGYSILRAERKLIDAHLTSDRVWTATLEGVEFRVCNCSCGPLVSEVAGALAEETGAGAAYAVLGSDKVLWSLRARGDDAPDVSVVARKFGGGGHRNAAGFNTSITVLQFIMEAS